MFFTQTKEKRERERYFIAHADTKVIKRSKGRQVSRVTMEVVLHQTFLLYRGMC